MAQQFTVNYNEMFTEVLEKPSTVASCYAMFHNFSINNQFLAYWQLKARGKQVSPIACLSKWNELGRSVNKGEKAIYLWMPRGHYQYTTNEKGERVKEYISTGFMFKPRWFALSQTNGKEFQAEKITLPNFDFDKVYDFYGIKLVDFEKLNGNIQGYANPVTRELAINPVAQDVEMTILHEVAHIALQHDKAEYGNDLKELEAETVAYICGSVLELNEKQLSNSRGYIQSWFKGNIIPEKQAKNIMKVAQKILDLGYNKIKKSK